MTVLLICFQGLLSPLATFCNLSGPEHESMKKYISEALNSGIICRSTSPVRAGFFFVAKKDKILRPCINDSGLNQITIKIKYPLPLIDSIHKQLHLAKVFFKAQPSQHLPSRSNQKGR